MVPPRPIDGDDRRRKFLIVVGDAPEIMAALAYAGQRASRTGGSLVLLAVTEPLGESVWLGVEATYREEAAAKARAVFRLYQRKLKGWGFEALRVEEQIREGDTAEAIAACIAADLDIGVLVLGAATDPAGPGPLVTSLVGRHAGSFPVPIIVVPGTLTPAQLDSLA
jgi:nucleotide-binding universal stress UspA family protein